MMAWISQSSVTIVPGISSRETSVSAGAESVGPKPELLRRPNADADSLNSANAKAFVAKGLGSS